MMSRNFAGDNRTLRDLSLEELQERLKQAHLDTEDIRIELEDAEEFEEELRDEIESRYRADRERLSAWNAAIREAKEMAQS